jgi:osmotically-inducible protein OsmY
LVPKGEFRGRARRTLSGQVKTYPEKEAATRAVMRVRGVTAVADEIEVKNTWLPREDSDIAREATEALGRIVSVPSGSVQAKVHHHMITLKPKSTIKPLEAKAQITAALVRNARFDSRRIEVDVTGTEIELRGTVSSWAELRQATYAAWATPGVTNVKNRLIVSA